MQHHRLGIGITTSTLQPFRFLDSDRTCVSLGLSYEPTDNLSLDLAYTHIFIARRSINQAEEGSRTLVGSYDNSVDIVAAQVNWRF